MRKFIVVFSMCILLSACVPAASAPQETSQGPEATQVSQAAIVLKRTGGLAGVTEQWSIYTDGKIISDKGGERKVSPEEVTKLLDEIQKLGFFEMPQGSKTGTKCRDCFQYTLTITKDGQTKTLTAIDGDPDTPAKLLQVVEKINQLIATQ